MHMLYIQRAIFDFNAPNGKQNSPIQANLNSFVCFYHWRNQHRIPLRRVATFWFSVCSRNKRRVCVEQNPHSPFCIHNSTYMTSGLINCWRKSCTFRNRYTAMRYCNIFFLFYFVLSLNFASIMALTDTTFSAIGIATNRMCTTCRRQQTDIEERERFDDKIKLFFGKMRSTGNECRNCTKASMSVCDMGSI